MYSFRSTDNERSYASEVLLGNESTSSVHGVSINGEAIVVVGAGGGCSGVHEHSALVIEGKLYLAVGDSVTCLTLTQPHHLLWSVAVDAATCFGLHWDELHRALIAHGELEISSVSLDGALLWQASGADIFSEGFRLTENHVEVVDFNNSIYRFDYLTGKTL